MAGPIYTGGGLTAAVDQAEARRDQSLANYELSSRTHFATSRIRSPTCVTAPSSGTPCSGASPHSSAASSSPTMRYENGYSDYLEVLDTERSLFSAAAAIGLGARRLPTRAGQSLSRAGRRLDLRSADRLHASAIGGYTMNDAAPAATRP